jgi:DNA-binding response OmpR family regulator
MAQPRVLVVEDDEVYHLLYQEFFELHVEEFAWVLAKSCDSAIAALKNDPHPFDVALLDWHLNQGTKNGFHVLQAIRSNPATKDMVTFMVTGNEFDRDAQAAIEAGVDDYITKPFKLDMLAARLRGRLNRQKQQASIENKVLELDGLTLTEQTAIVVLNGQRLDLYPTERTLLAFFLAHTDRMLSADQLWHAVRGYDSGTAGEALGQQVRNLRKKLGAWGDHIETLRGQGYLLNSRFPVSQG